MRLLRMMRIFSITVKGRSTGLSRREILKEKVVPFLEKLGPQYRFQQDNACVHTVKIVRSFLSKRGVLMMHWPTKSPDLSVIEEVWALINKWLSELKNRPRACWSWAKKFVNLGTSWSPQNSAEISLRPLRTVCANASRMLNNGPRINY